MKNITVQKQMSISTIFTSIGIVALLMIFASCSSNKKMVEDIDLMSIHENNSTVAAYISYVEANNSRVPDHAYITNALVKLADAANAMAGEIGYTLVGDINMAKDAANKITNNSNEATHADNIRKSADILSSALQNMQQAKYPSLATAGSVLISASTAIEPAVLTHHQKVEIMAFFNRAEYLLEKMN